MNEIAKLSPEQYIGVVQCATGDSVVEKKYFLDDRTTDLAFNEESFDYIVVGSSFGALAFIEEMYALDPHSRILLLERGTLFFPDHFHNLPLTFQPLCRLSAYSAWKISKKTTEAEFIRSIYGLMPFFGGRSTYWSAWTPKPSVEDLSGWPTAIKDLIENNFSQAAKCLNIQPFDELDAGHRSEASGDVNARLLHQRLHAAFAKHIGESRSYNRLEAAPIAMAKDANRLPEKCATPHRLFTCFDRQKNLSISGAGSPLSIVPRCAVEKIVHDTHSINGTRATMLQTTRGNVHLGNAKLILASGALPATTLVANSFPAEQFPDLKNVGERFTGHSMSLIVARVPRLAFDFEQSLPDWAVSAFYMAGNEQTSGLQYHTQFIVLADRHPAAHLERTSRYAPELLDKSSHLQMQSCGDHILFVCTALGELDHHNSENWFRRNDDADLTQNSTAQVIPNAADLATWDAMEQATFEALERSVRNAADQASEVEYWHGDQAQGVWKPERPSKNIIRKSGLAHEASTLWIGDDDDPSSPVDTNFKLRGVENVYITGGGLFPTAGSWNPTGVIVLFAQELAARLAKHFPTPAP